MTIRLGFFTFLLCLSVSEHGLAADEQTVDLKSTTLTDRLITVALDNLFRNAQPVNKMDGPVLIDSKGCLWSVQESDAGVSAEKINDDSGKQACRNSHRLP